jgi:hypothetical protein
MTEFLIIPALTSAVAVAAANMNLIEAPKHEVKKNSIIGAGVGLLIGGLIIAPTLIDQQVKQHEQRIINGATATIQNNTQKLRDTLIINGATYILTPKENALEK